MTVVYLELILEIQDLAIETQEQFLELKERIRVAVRDIHPGIGSDENRPLEPGDDPVDTVLLKSAGSLSNGKVPQDIDFYRPHGLDGLAPPAFK